ncbi:uncharacterized protein G2W53_021791 [Senna tora]|uniref:Uncharacterized protein n=1 Tax=Senna tora TaxID=362788 RepID=A0A834TK35_9FABA|nr:uncharacterized protein G2W53_021791 [Senna tora]
MERDGKIVILAHPSTLVATKVSGSWHTATAVAFGSRLIFGLLSPL